MEVKAGELLLCEKAFAVAFAGLDTAAQPPKSAIKSSAVDKDKKKPEDNKQFGEMRAELGANAMTKLDGNPSLVANFAELYAGPNAEMKRDSNTKTPLVDV